MFDLYLNADDQWNFKFFIFSNLLEMQYLQTAFTETLLIKRLVNWKEIIIRNHLNEFEMTSEVRITKIQV